ncbi:MAG: helix-turn-helix domain-containing protein [Myxococcales bacterium]
MNAPEKTGNEALSRNEQKWGHELMAAGWTAIPSVILDRQRALGLDSVDLNILLQLAKHWWDAGNPPYPSKRSIAAAIGIDPRTVQRRIADLERGGLIKRRMRRNSTGGNKSNVYLFDGLIERTKPFAREELDRRADRAKAKEEAKGRKRPRILRAVE